ncbi:MAG: YtxH domain-containing protein [Myxococcales bacterium]|nr:YtxH domain-containing protein [Myxococcales bacterium]
MKTPSFLRDASNLLDRLEARGVDVDAMLSRVGLARASSHGYGLLPMVGSFAIGMAVGAGLGVLFAPTKGEETRRVIREKAEDLLARTMGSHDEEAPEERPMPTTQERERSNSTGSRAHA